VGARRQPWPSPPVRAPPPPRTSAKPQVISRKRVNDLFSNTSVDAGGGRGSGKAEHSLSGCLKVSQTVLQRSFRYACPPPRTSAGGYSFSSLWTGRLSILTLQGASFRYAPRHTSAKRESALLSRVLTGYPDLSKTVRPIRFESGTAPTQAVPSQTDAFTDNVHLFSRY